MHRAPLLLGLAFIHLASAIVLIACGRSESPAPPAKSSPAISPEATTAPGRLYLTDGRVLPADEWWESGDLLFYRWRGEVELVLKAQVQRIDGRPREREVVGTETPSTLTPTPEAAPPAPVSSPPVAQSGRIAPFTVKTATTCPWRRAPQCIHTFPDGTFTAWGETSGDLRVWRWRLFLANHGPAATVDVRLEFRNPSLSFDYVKRCGELLPGMSTTTIFGDHSVRGSTGDVFSISIEVEERAKWC